MYKINEDQNSTIGTYLEKLADSIDLSQSQQDIAIKRYLVIGEWLASEDSPLAKYNPRIISQGSFRTGTAVRPANGDCEFDVDLTCILDGSLPEIQLAIKALVGKRLEKHCEHYSLTLEEKRRCWRIHYKETAGFSFHLDIVPALPDDFSWVTDQGVPREYAQHAIVITDLEAETYEHLTHLWPKSNTEGYSQWFIEAMKYNAEKITKAFSAGLMEAINKGTVEEVPVFNVRSPLQRTVQLMKRHRDIMFGDHEDKPVSVIITTLAARAYLDVVDRLEPISFYDVLNGIIDRMTAYIEYRNGVAWVANPVNPRENFADKWAEHPEKREIFMRWLKVLRTDASQEIALNEGVGSLTKAFSNAFGESSAKNALNEMAGAKRQMRETGKLKMTSSGLLSAVGSIGVANHTFHGKKDKA